MGKRGLNVLAASLVLGGALWSGFGSGAGSVMASTSASAAIAGATVQQQEAVHMEPGKTTVFSDMAGHWAEAAVDKWRGRGIVQGLGNGKFEPNRGLTRSEWVTLVNRMFQIQANAAGSFPDVKATDWFAADVQAAQASGYIRGYQDGTFKPNGLVTREQAAVTVANFLKLQSAEAPANGKVFKDEAALGAWSKSGVYAAAGRGLIQGSGDGLFRPDQVLTRAEAVALLDRAVQVYGSWYGEAGEYGPEQAEAKVKEDGNVIVNASGITLRNMEIAGDLIIGKGVGEGDVTLSNVTVHGQTFVYGGGEHSIHLDNSVIVNIIVNKKDGTVRLVAKGSTSIQEVVVKTGANVEAEKGVQVSKVSLTKELPADSKVRLAGYFDTVNVEAYSLALNIPEGAIGELNVSKEASGAQVDTGKEASILSLVLDAAAKVTGLGSIEKATVNAAGSSFDKAPAQVKTGSQLAGDATVTIGGKEMKAAEAAAAVTPSTSASATSPAATEGSTSSGGSTGSSGSGSGGSGGGGTGGGTTGGSPGGNTGNTPGGSLPGGGSNPQVPGERPGVSLEREAVSVGEAVYFTSSQDGKAYILNEEIAYYDFPTVQLAVESGEALTKAVRAGERSYFDTSLLNNVGYPRNYEFNIVVYNASGNYEAKELVILDESETLTENPGLTHYGSDPEYFTLNFNRLLEVAPGKTTESLVELALNGSDVFEPFTAALGTVEVKNNKVIIRPIESQLGKDFKFRLLQGSVVTSDAQSNVEYMTGPINSFVKITLLSHGGSYVANAKIGDTIEFSIGDAGTVYLVPNMISGSQETFDEKVTEGWGKKLEVTAEQASHPVTLSTEGLSPGSYQLMVWHGHSVQVELSE